MPSDPLPVDPQDRAAERASKQPYHAPQLSCLGPLAEVTRTSVNGASVDGGSSFPNVYAS
jgi:hypothetical protein